MKKRPSIFGNMPLSAEHTQNRNWKDAVDSPFSQLMEGMTLTTRIVIGLFTLVTLGGCVWTAKQGIDALYHRAQGKLATQMEKILTNVEKHFSDDSPDKHLSPEAKAQKLEAEKKRLAQLANKFEKNVYGYEAAQNLAKLAIDEALQEYDLRIAAPASDQELEIQQEASFKEFPVDSRRAYAFRRQSREHEHYLTAKNWLAWSVERAPNPEMRFRAQKKLARVLWALSQFQEAFELLDQMETKGDYGIQVHSLRAAFFSIQGKHALALQEYEAALKILEKTTQLMGEKGLPAEAQEALKITRLALEYRIALFKAISKVENLSITEALSQAQAAESD